MWGMEHDLANDWDRSRLGEAQNQREGSSFDHGRGQGLEARGSSLDRRHSGRNLGRRKVTVDAETFVREARIRKYSRVTFLKAERA